MSLPTTVQLRKRSYKVALAAFAACLIIAAVPKTSEAVPPILRPATRAMFATFGLGPVIGMNWGLGTDFQLEGAFGWHFGGTGSGPAIGGQMGLSFGSGALALNLGPRFWYDIQPMADMGLYLTPFAQIGFSAVFTDPAYGFFNMIFGAEARLALGNRGMVFFRPISVDLNFGKVTIARWNLMFGGGVYF